VVLSRTLGQDGLVIVQGQEPVLRAASDGTPALLLFGTPGVTYDLEATDTLVPAIWVHQGSATLTTTFTRIPLSPDGTLRFFRARAP
jgi:hypothetical protein